MTAPQGAIVSIYVDTFALVDRGDVIETGTGRRYGVVFVRIQQRGKHAGRQHLQCCVFGPDDEVSEGVTIHLIHWYGRGRKRHAKPRAP